LSARAPAPGLGPPTQAASISRDNGRLSHSLIQPSPQDHAPLWGWMRSRARWWRFAEGASISEIGSRLGCGEATVRELLQELP
jgi:hypothetical protein